MTVHPYWNGNKKVDAETTVTPLTQGRNSKADFLHDLSVALVGYVSIHNIEQLRDYLIPRTRVLAFVAIHTVYVGSAKSSLDLYQNGMLTKHLMPPPRLGRSLPFYQYFLPFLYALHVCLFVICTLRLGKVFDLFLGVSYQSTLAGVIMKRLRITRRLVYYRFDYFPTTHSMSSYMRLATRVFRILDRVCTAHSDVVWDLSDEMRGIGISKYMQPATPEIVVPHPIMISEKVRPHPEGPYIAFIGSLRKSQGLDIVLDALPAIKEEVPFVKLFVVGSGPEEKDLRRRASAMGVEDRVEFLGFVASQATVEEILTSCAFGVAVYSPGEAEFIRYADPGKIKKYLSCGLPVLVTAGPEFAKHVEAREAGLVVSCDKEQIARAAVYLLTEQGTLRQFRRNALALASELDAQKIFDKAFHATRKFMINNDVLR